MEKLKKDLQSLSVGVFFPDFTVVASDSLEDQFVGVDPVGKGKRGAQVAP